MNNTDKVIKYCNKHAVLPLSEWNHSFFGLIIDEGLSCKKHSYVVRNRIFKVVGML